MEIGSLLKGKYKIIKQIAETEFSNVYIATTDKDTFVVKECYPKNVNDKQFELVVRSFENEVANLKKLKHDNIVKIIESFEISNRIYVVLEYCKGITLKKFILSNDLKENEIMKLFYKILEPMHEIHKKGIIHRDIKPSNIIIDENLEIKIIDFGSSINREEKNGEYIKVTEGYSPLEMYSTSTDIDERTDIYSLFALLYFMLNKQKPMDASKRFHYPELLFEDGISDNMKKFLEKGLALEKKDRFGSIDEIRNKKS